MGWNTEFEGSIGSIHQHCYANRVAGGVADDAEGFLNPAAFGHHVFDHQQAFTGVNPETAAQDELAFLLLGKDETEAELAGDFLSNHQSAHCWRNHGVSSQVAYFPGQCFSKAGDDGHLLEGKCTLEELAGMKSTSKDEVSVQQRARLAEK